MVEFTPAMEPHWCENGHIGVVLEGEFEIKFDGDIVTYKSGDGVFIPSGSEHRHMGKALTDVVRVVFEPTGHYGRPLERAFAVAGIPAVKVNPRRARRFAEAIGIAAKTDAIDLLPTTTHLGDTPRTRPWIERSWHQSNLPGI